MHARCGRGDRGGRRRGSSGDYRPSSSSPARWVCGPYAEEARIWPISSSPVAETTFLRLPDPAWWTNGEVEARLIEPRPMAVLSDSGAVVVGFQGQAWSRCRLDAETGHQVFSRVVLEVGLRADLVAVTLCLTASGYRVDEIRRVAGAGLSGHLVTVLRLAALCASLPLLAARPRLDMRQQLIGWTPWHPFGSRLSIRRSPAAGRGDP